MQDERPTTSDPEQQAPMRYTVEIETRHCGDECPGHYEASVIRGPTFSRESWSARYNSASPLTLYLTYISNRCAKRP